MQGKKAYTEKMFTNFRLSERVPEDNLYRLLASKLDLNFIYKETKSLYGKTGNPSLDPKVFLKLVLVGYLENITSDRKLVDHCSMRMDILFFLGYDIDESLPWHSTVSRTRNLFPQDLYEQLFNKVFELCVESGLVSGYAQSVDSTICQANAAKHGDRIVDVIQPSQTIENHLKQSKQENSDNPDNEEKPSFKDIDKTKGNGKKKVNSKRRSATDPDARFAFKPGKGTQLGYLCNVAVDSKDHVITHIQADFADQRDSECLPSILDKLSERLTDSQLPFTDLLADTNYSTGENYQLIESGGINSWIPVHGGYHGNKEGFRYDDQHDQFICRNNKKLKLRSRFTDNRGNQYKSYITYSKDCKGCRFQSDCRLTKQGYKVIKRSAFHHYYDKAYVQMQSEQGCQMRKLRSSRVEPVIGSLMNIYKLRRLTVRGIQSVNKQMILAACAYNLKKLLNKTKNDLENGLKTMKHIIDYQIRLIAETQLTSILSH